jgi:hypothetical protein
MADSMNHAAGTGVVAPPYLFSDSSKKSIRLRSLWALADIVQLAYFSFRQSG